MSVNTQHPEYAKHYPKWVMMRDALNDEVIKKQLVDTNSLIDLVIELTIINERDNERDTSESYEIARCGRASGIS